MAGDYIVMRIDLSTDPAVLRMAGRLKLRPEVIVGYLHKVWSWFSTHTNDGRSGLPSQSIDAAINLPGFCAEMILESWLKIDNEGNAYVPRWTRWNSQSAKKRLKKSLQKRIQRVAKSGDKTATKRRQHSSTATATATAAPTGQQLASCWARLAADLYSGFGEDQQAKAQDLAGRAYRKLKLQTSHACPVRDAAIMLVAGKISEADFHETVEESKKAKKNARTYFAAILNRKLDQKETAAG